MDRRICVGCVIKDPSESHDMAEGGYVRVVRGILSDRLDVACVANSSRVAFGATIYRHKPWIFHRMATREELAVAGISLEVPALAGLPELVRAALESQAMLFRGFVDGPALDRAATATTALLQRVIDVGSLS